MVPTSSASFACVVSASMHFTFTSTSILFLSINFHLVYLFFEINYIIRTIYCSTYRTVFQSNNEKKAPDRSRVPFLPVYLLCLYLRTIPESDRDCLVSAYRDELDHAAPKAVIKFTDGAVLCLQHLDEVSETFALRFLGGDGGYHLIVPSLRRIVPLDKPIVAFLVLVLILCNAGILRNDVLRHFHKNRHLFLQLALFFLQGIGDAERFTDDLSIGDDFFL